MSTSDVIKKSFLEGFQTDISLGNILITLGITIVLALFIYWIYRLSSDQNFYSRDFNKSMVASAVVTASIVLAMQSSIVISLGMVGALSIIRFRNAVKNSLDLLFIFWSISVGIICGAGQYGIAILASLAVTAMIFLLDLFRMPRAPYVLVLNTEKEMDEALLLKTMKEHSRNVKVKTRNRTMSGRNYVIQLNTEKEDELMNACQALPGVINLSLLSHDGELRV